MEAKNIAMIPYYIGRNERKKEIEMKVLFSLVNQYHLQNIYTYINYTADANLHLIIKPVIIIYLYNHF